MSSPQSVFLSYAREDLARVQAVYRSLRLAGVPAWMDEPPAPWESEGLPPGCEWESELRRRLDGASMILAFLSHVSVRKPGYVQKEFRLALEICSRRPPGAGTLVPVLLDECKVPDLRVDTFTLHQLQWYRLDQKGVESLVSHVSHKLGIATATGPDKDLQILDLQMEVNWLRAQIEKHISREDELRAALMETQAEAAADFHRYLDWSRRDY